MRTEIVHDRRGVARAKLKISCAWGATPDTPRTGTISSLSRQGCFVQTKAATVTQGQRMYLKLWLPTFTWLELTGATLYHMEGVGFGVKFTGLSPADELALDELTAQPVQQD